MDGDRGPGAPQVLVRIGPAQRVGLRHGQSPRHIPGQRVVGGGLVGHEVEVLPSPGQLGHDVGRVPEQANGERAAGERGGTQARERVLQGVGRLIEVARLEPAIDAGLVDLDAEDRRPRERRGQRLGAAHPSQARCEDRPPGERRGTEVLLARGGERLVGALQDSLRADVNPRSGGHLAEHGQALGLEAPELVPRRPLRHEQRVRDQDARRIDRGPEHRHGLARLNEQCLVVRELEQRMDDCLERLVRACRLAAAAVDDEVLGAFGDVGVEVVQQHAERRLRRP